MTDPWIVVNTPQVFSDAEIHEIEKLVLQGGEVDTRNLTENLRNAYRIGVVYTGGLMVGVGVIKRLGTHHDTVVRCSGFLDPGGFSAEIGYFYIDPSRRQKGLAGSLFELLMRSYPDPVYATTRQDNEAMQHILEKGGFSRVGQPWGSRQSPGRTIHLWVGPRRAGPPK